MERFFWQRNGGRGIERGNRTGGEWALIPLTSDALIVSSGSVHSAQRSVAGADWFHPRFFHPPETVAVRAAGHTCARISSVCSRAIRRQKFRCKPFKTGSSLFPMGEQTKPILSFGGIDRSWASSRDESLRERLRLIVSARGFLGPAHRRQVIAVCDQQTPPLTPETISRRGAPTFRHLAKLISGFLL